MDNIFFSLNKCFLKKVWRNKFSFDSLFVKSGSFSFVHLIIEKIRSWNIKILYFFSGKVLSGFLSINKLRLKNIFLKVVKDQEVWFEIEKMFDSGIINFSNNSLYNAFDFNKINSFSYLLFNVYLSELDFYIFSIFYKFNKKFLMMNSSLDKYYKNKYLPSKVIFLPVKLNIVLYSYDNEFKYLSLSKFHSIKNNQLFLKLNSYFERKINFVRYIDCVNWFGIGNN